MRVRVLFFGILKEIVGRNEESLEVEPDLTLAHLFDQYSQRYETLQNKRSSILFARNREFATPDTVLYDNDEVAFLPPVSGGSDMAASPQGHVFAITRGPIDARQLAAQVQRPDDGAVVTFEGVVRNNTKGRETTHLEYEGYEGMALDRMKRIGHQVAEQFSLGRIGIVHRVGVLQIGEASVVIVAAAPHRKAAFEAAFEAINRLKREVPIWKKEYFKDGAVWVDGEWDNTLLFSASKHAP
jgi:MoaE-MoaD fusion protein